MDDRTKTARESFNQATTAGESVAQDAQQRYATAVQTACDLNMRLAEMARANAEAAFEAGRQVANAKNPADLVLAWSTHATKQFAMLTDQATELTGVWQKFFASPR